MSGGSYGYVFQKIDEIKILDTTTDKRRASFQKLLKLIVQAMRDIEWVDSGDKSPGDEHEAIDMVFAFLGKDPEMVVKAGAFDALKEQLEEFLK